MCNYGILYLKTKEDISMKNKKKDTDKQIDLITSHIQAIMDILEIPITEGNKDTPRRIAKMYCKELFKNRNNQGLEELKDQIKIFDSSYRSTVHCSDIPFHSVCEHHWMPFFGTVSVSYTPRDGKVIGLSKIPRIVKYFSAKPQLQEKLTDEIGNFLVECLDPLYVRVYIEATHTCVLCRGVESNGTTQTEFVFNAL